MKHRQPRYSPGRKPLNSRYYQPPRQRPAVINPVHGALSDWLLRELGSWFYSVMRFNQWHPGGMVTIEDRHTGDKSRTVAHVQFCDGHVVLSSPYSSPSLSINYADPNLLDLIQHTIRKLYNGMPGHHGDPA